MVYGLIKTMLLGLAIINLSGCVGYYQSSSSALVDKDMTLALLVVPENDRQLWKNEKAKRLESEKFINDERALPLATIPIGQKDRKKEPVVKETRIYNDKKRWCGRTIWAIIPIPLLSPSCRTYTELTIEDGEPVSARQQYLEKTAHICGPFVPMVKDSKGFCLESKDIE